jgi:DeoR/GlpR family transcriptional regulator of sugar metabolism
MARRKDHRDMKEISAALIELAGRPMGVSRVEAAEALGTSEISASNFLYQLSKHQKIRRVRGGKASRYCMPDRVQAVQAHIEEYEHEQELAQKVRTIGVGQLAHRPVKGQVSSVWDLAK